MKHRPLLLLALAIAAFAAGGCATSPLSRIDQDRAKYESWPLDVQEAVLAGEARKGMTREQVEMAMGKPTEIVTRSVSDEVWIYRKTSGGSGLLGGTGVMVGTGGAGVSLGGGGRRETPEEYEVVFSKGVVIRSDSK